MVAKRLSFAHPQLIQSQLISHLRRAAQEHSSPGQSFMPKASSGLDRCLMGKFKLHVPKAEETQTLKFQLSCPQVRALLGGAAFPVYY